MRPIEIEPIEIGIDRKSYFAKTADRRPIEDRIIQDRTITKPQAASLPDGSIVQGYQIGFQMT